MRERTIRLRRNKPDRKGRPGFWKMRLTWVKDPRLVGKLYEVGLGTRDAREAVNMARGVQALIRALEGKTPLILFSESEFPVHRGGMKGQTFAQEADNMRTEIEEKPTSVISETNVGTEIGTNVAPYVETYPKTVREGKEGIHPLTPSPCTVEEVEDHLRAAAFAGRVRLTPDQIPDCATAYWGSRDAVNWTRNGISVTKWQSDAISFATSYAVNHPPPPGNGDKDPYSNLEEL